MKKQTMQCPRCQEMAKQYRRLRRESDRVSVDYYECANGHQSATINGEVVTGDKEIIGRQEAIGKGLKRYFTGIPCVKGHIAEHSVTGGCIRCKDIADAKRKKEIRRMSNTKQKIKCSKCDLFTKTRSTHKRNDGCEIRRYVCAAGHDCLMTNGEWDDAALKYLSRKEALEKNLPRYFTGQQCPRGHISERKTKKGLCVECEKIFKQIDKSRAKVERENNYEIKSPEQAETRRQLEELRIKYPNIRVIKGYAQSGSK